MKIKELDISKLNVREVSESDESIDALAGSIKDQGLINKIILLDVNGKYEILAGQRRYYALKKAFGEDHELEDTDYVIKEGLSDKEALVLSLTENQFRQEFSPFDLNKAILALNKCGYKDKEIAKILNVTPHRLKRLETLGSDSNRMPPEIREELHKVDAKFSDAHWQKVRDIEDKDIIKDVYDQIVTKELPPKEVPSLIKAIQKTKESMDSDGDGKSPKSTVTSWTAPEDEPPQDVDSPITYEHKGELMMVETKTDKKFYIRAKSGDDQIPVDQYLEYLRYPDKFRCVVTFKLIIKPKE